MTAMQSMAGQIVQALESLPLDEAIRWAEGLDLNALRRSFVERGYSPEFAEKMSATVAYYASAATEPGNRLSLALERGIENEGPGIRRREYATTGALCPRYPSSIDVIDHATCGGFYGVTVIGGEPGVGKSMLALACSYLAALSGWRVFYFDTELGDANLNTRITSLLKAEPALRDVVRPSSNHTRWLMSPPIMLFDANRPKRLDELLEQVVSEVAPWDDKVLVVVDSVNKLASRLQSGGDGWEQFRIVQSIGSWAEQARKQTDGHVGFILVSELTRGGGIKGRDLEYAADVDVRLTRGRSDDYTAIRIAKGREGGERDYGAFLREWRIGRFVPPDSGEPPVPAPKPTNGSGNDPCEWGFK